jgi:mannose-6-phosphate isomerase-like protein (cupin superfamily)
MRKVMRGVVALLFALAMANHVRAQATDVTNAEIQAALKKTASASVSDQQLRVVSVGGQYNVAIGVIHRAKTTGRGAGGALDHHQVAEVYHIVEGNATLVTGGVMDNSKEAPADGELVKVLTGPTASGSGIKDGVSRKVGPGDVIIIPPNTPHGFSEITSNQLVYLVVRIDPEKVLPAGYAAK